MKPIDALHNIHIEENEVSGQVGFILTALSRFENPIVDFGSGEMIAHDIVEHVNGVDAIGTLEDELTALGAMFAVRVENKYLSEEKFAGMYYELFEHFKKNAHVLDDLEKATSTPDAGDSVKDALTVAVSAIKDEYGLVSSESEEKLFLTFSRAAVQLGLAGYQKLTDRFATFDKPRAQALVLFKQIENAVQSVKSAADDEIIGAKFALKIDNTSATIS
tara:strand:+ start:4353 stop:5009 length:657 start_codon:yes stop_codon:yes gene_type:complete